MKSYTAATAELTSEREALLDAYRSIRRFTEALCETLHPEDMVVQTMPEVSPTKWHLAHTAWFFETFILQEAIDGYENPVKEYPFLFNSYYQAAGPMHCRARRGLISRPTVDQVLDYRRKVDERMLDFLSETSDEEYERWKTVVVTGLHHERQHQELMVTDIKHVFGENPLKPTFRESQPGESAAAAQLDWQEFDEGVYHIGHEGDTFHYDNEKPRHRRFLEPFALADRLTTCGEYLEFIEDCGYRRPEFWLSLGWATLQEERWQAPLYWEKRDGDWRIFTLGGERELDPNEPVCHVSLFEAAAFARWSGARLPEEFEWEVAAADRVPEGNFVESGRFHPAPQSASESACGLYQLFGDVWEWTRSSYSPYPGYEAAFGALGEYNGKFMCNQYVLRGGSCATAQSHVRSTYRNFFQPDKRWQFTGIRLAKDAK